MYKIQTLQPILHCFSGGEKFSPTQIAEMVGKSKVLVHKYLKELVAQGKLKKVGSGTHVTYVSTIKMKPHSSSQKKMGATISLLQNELNLSYSDKKTLQETFYKFAENGEILDGMQGFLQWCQLRRLDPQDKAVQYLKVHKHVEKLKNSCGVINVTDAFSEHVEHMGLDTVYYADQYNWMEFGRGKLAEMTFYAKQSQNIPLINQVIDMIVLNIECLVIQKKIDAIAIIPPSIVRVNQLLKILKKKLIYLGLPFVHIVKYYPNQIPIPQKSLKTREQRIRNAQLTILLDDKHLSIYNNVLLIDDFVGSGGTLNETAHKLKIEGVQNVYGFAFVGNANLKYDIINEI